MYSHICKVLLLQDMVVVVVMAEEGAEVEETEAEAVVMTKEEHSDRHLCMIERQSCNNLPDNMFPLADSKTPHNH
jgi:hypothetical protein